MLYTLVGRHAKLIASSKSRLLWAARLRHALCLSGTILIIHCILVEDLTIYNNRCDVSQEEKVNCVLCGVTRFAPFYVKLQFFDLILVVLQDLFLFRCLFLLALIV